VRQDPDPTTVSERDSLGQYLDYQRETILLKTDGLTKEQLAQQIPSSGLTLAGLLYHLALVEESWSEEDFLGLKPREDFAGIDWEADPDYEFRTALGKEPDWLRRRYRDACNRSRQVMAGADSLDTLSTGRARRSTARPASRRPVYRQEHRPSEQAVIIRARQTALNLTLGFFALVFIAALAASESDNSTTSGRVTAAVFFGLLLLATVGGWFLARRSRRQIEVGRDAIVSRPQAQNASRRGAKAAQPVTLARRDGDTLRILPQFRLYGVTRQPRLIFLGRGGFITLGSLPAAAVTRACQAQGWRFDGDPSLAVRDVQDWLNHGYSVEAVQLLQLFGPFPAAAADGQPNIGLDAAVYEDVGDKLSARSRVQARDAYQRAAAAQRAFAGYAGSPSDGEARTAEAVRIDGKATA
jgi:hypothetical protein